MQEISILCEFHLREEDDVADGRFACQQHDKAVDAHAETARRRHAVVQRVEEVFVDTIDFAVGIRAADELLVETGALFDRIVQFRISGADLLTVDFQFIDVNQIMVVFAAFRERDEIGGEARHERRLDQCRLDRLVVDFMGDGLVVHVVRDVESEGFRFFALRGQKKGK